MGCVTRYSVKKYKKHLYKLKNVYYNNIFFLHISGKFCAKNDVLFEFQYYWERCQLVTEFLAEVVALATCSRSTCAGFPRYFAERGTKQLQNTSQTNYLKTQSNTKAEQHSMLLHFENGPIPKGHMIFDLDIQAFMRATQNP